VDDLSFELCQAFESASCQLPFPFWESSCAVHRRQIRKRLEGDCSSKTRGHGRSLGFPDVAMSSCCASVRGDSGRNEGSNRKQDAAIASRTGGRGGQYRRRSGCRVPFRLLVPLLIVLSIDAQVRRSCQQPSPLKSSLC